MPELVDEVPARVLAVYAHPDDPEVSCGGPLARWSAAGAEVHVVICAQGDKGTLGPGLGPAWTPRPRRCSATRARWAGPSSGSGRSSGSGPRRAAAPPAWPTPKASVCSASGPDRAHLAPCERRAPAEARCAVRSTVLFGST